MNASVQHCLLWSAEDVAIRFLESLTVGDAELAGCLLAPDVDVRFGAIWHGVGRSAVTGALTRSRHRFDVVIHEIVARGEEVSMRRTDHVTRGRLRIRLMVSSRVQVRDGRITRWSDEVTRAHLATAVIRGLAGSVMTPTGSR